MPAAETPPLPLPTNSSKRSHMVSPSSASLVLSAGRSTVGDLFHSVAAAYPGRIALQDEDVSLSYAELESRSNRLAGYLVNRGVQPGDRIAVLSRNRFEYFELLLAAAKTGAILAALNWRLLDGELEHCIDLVFRPGSYSSPPSWTPRSVACPASRPRGSFSAQNTQRPLHRAPMSFPRGTSTPRRASSSCTPAAPRACPRER